MINSLRSYLLNKIIKNRFLSEEERSLLKGAKKLERFGFQKMGIFSDNDVFIIGYPKSGTTLLQFIIAHLCFGLSKFSPVGLINTCVSEYYNTPYFFRLSERHFFKSHELPKKEYKHVIYIVRDGRDAVKSLCTMNKNLGLKNQNISEMLESGGQCFVGTWSDHVESWITNPFQCNLLIIKYEDLIYNKREVLDKICDFLRLSVSYSTIDNVIESTSIESMKVIENSWGWKHKKSFRNWNKNGRFVDKGLSDNHKNSSDFSQNSLKIFNEKSKAMLEKFDYNL